MISILVSGPWSECTDWSEWPELAETVSLQREQRVCRETAATCSQGRDEDRAECCRQLQSLLTHSAGAGAGDQPLALAVSARVSETPES